MIGQIGKGLMTRSGNLLQAQFRLYPLDMDVYGHMNNACYLRVAELARWRQFAQGGMLVPCLRKGWLFIIAEQSVSYFRPILPFRTFVVRSEITVVENEKWVYYQHYFQSSSKEGSTVYAHIRMKCVIKQSNGKTIMPDEFVQECPELEKWLLKMPSTSKI